jgi:hypothetical protein
MSGVFARAIAQGVIFGVGVLSKAFQQAYAKAQAGGAQAAKSATAGSRMPLDQARQILNFEKGELVTAERVLEQHTKYYATNDPDKGGSFYIQAKVSNAREALLADLRRKQAGGGGGGAAAGGAEGGAKASAPRSQLR